MILFRTKFPVSDELTQVEFLNLFCEFIQKSDFYGLKPVFDEKESGEYLFEDTETGAQKLLVYKTKEYVAVQLTAVDNDIVFVDTYVLTELDGNRILFIQLEQMSSQISGQVDFQFQIPQFIRDIFWREYGGIDHGVRVDDKPLILRKSNMDLATQILSHKLCLLNPVVYITPERNTGSYLIDCNHLASQLLGMAHVMVAGSPYVADLIQELYSMSYDDGGAFVVLPNGDMKLFYVDSYGNGQDLHNAILEYIRQVMINVTVEDALSFSHLRVSYLLSNSSNASDLSDIYEELLAEKDSMIQSLRNDLDSANRQVSDLRSKSEALRYSLSKSKSDENAMLEVSVMEQPLYEHEIEDVILKVLKKEYDAMTGDKSLMQSRKYHVLADLLNENKVTDVPEEIRAVFEKYIKGGTLNRDGMHEVERYGFSVTKAGNNHYKVVYQNDGRYQMAMGSSPSDSRSGDNFVTSYMNLLFGY